VFDPATLGSSDKHINDYTTEATFFSHTNSFILKLKAVSGRAQAREDLI
jgi:hypothetical protein